MTTLALATLDFAAIALYVGLLVASGILLSRKQADTEDYFLADRKMPAWAVAISVLATATSAATFIGGPQQAYAENLTYLSATIGSVLAACLVAFVLLPAFYRLAVTTVYELLADRFGEPARVAGTLMFMLGRLMASGVRIFIAAHALAFVVTGALEPGAIAWSVVALVIVGVLYTVWGGIATVIWTDVIQTVVFIGAVAIAFLVLLFAVNDQTGSLTNTLQQLGELEDPEGNPKSTLLSLSTDISQDFTLWTAIIGFTLFNAAAYGTDQDLAQRLLTCKTPGRAAKSMIAASLLGLPVTALFMVIGLLLHLYAPTSPDNFEAGEGVKPFLYFITEGVPAGVGGLLVAGVFAAGLSSLDSALNALSSTFVTDIYRKLAPNKSKAHELRVARIGVAGWGIALGAFALLCVWIRSGDDSSTLLAFALNIMTYPYSGLLGVFLTATLTRRGSTASALAALITGPIVVLAFEHLINAPDPDEGFVLAFPWRLTLGVIASFLVCIIAPGKSPPTRSEQ